MEITGSGVFLTIAFVVIVYLVWRMTKPTNAKRLEDKIEAKVDHIKDKIEDKWDDIRK